mgnify:FL=1
MLFIYKPDLERYRAFVSDFLIQIIVKDMTSKEQQKQLLTDIMEADAKDGLYDQQTPMESLLVHLEMLKSKVDTIDIQSLIDTIKQSYL